MKEVMSVSRKGLLPKFLLLLYVVLASSNTKAVIVETGFHLMLKEGKIWNYSYQTTNGERRLSIEVKGDTVIKNHLCHKLYLHSTYGSWLYGCYYEDNYPAQVWTYQMVEICRNGDELTIEKKEADSPVLLYVFEGNMLSWHYANRGNLFMAMMESAFRSHVPSLLQSSSHPIQLIHSDLINVGGRLLAREHIAGNTTEGKKSETWVSGVGDSIWGIMKPDYTKEGWIEFESCYEDGQCLFTRSDFSVAPLQLSYRPFVEDNKVWTYSGSVYGAKTYQFYLSGDTIINGQHCLKMYSQNEFNDGKDVYKGAYYEHDKKVYRFLPNKTEVELQYDFSLQPGSPIMQYPLGNSLGLSGDSLGVQLFTESYELHDGILCRIMGICEVKRHAKDNSLSYEQYGAWIEGVGPSHKLDVGFSTGFSLIGGAYGLGIMDCSVNGNSIYHSSWYNDATVGVLPCQNNRQRRGNIYNLYGQRLTTTPTKGIYIRDGKKSFVKQR